jgi:2-polyprenyl-3-methyl-5-hydroxy-6-metoxy-1,4-benzoquinol methylase
MRHGLNLPTVLCENCALCLTNPQPTEATLASFYENYYHLFHGRKKGVEESYIKLSTNLASKRVSLIKKLVTNQMNPMKVLEIGPGAGQFIKQLSAATDWSITGIELGRESYEYCKSENLDVHYVSIENFKTESKFSAIASFHVLEHIRSPKAFLSKCYDLLTEDGLLYIEVPNYYKPGTVYENILQFPHLYNFSHTTLSNYMRKSGFEIIYINESTHLTVIGRKTTTSAKYFIKTDVSVLAKKILWVDRIQRISSKIPSFTSGLKKIKSTISQISI